MPPAGMRRDGELDTPDSRGRARIYRRITYAQCPHQSRVLRERFNLWPTLLVLSPSPPPALFFRGPGTAARLDSVCVYITTCTIWHAFCPGGCSLAPGSALSSLATSQGFKV